jgi:hypothetical protein
MLAAVTLAPAADTIEELLQQDEASGQNDVLRPDLNALTEAKWEYYFKVGQQSDTQLESPLVVRESEKPARLMVPVQMEDLNVTIAAYAGPEMDGRMMLAHSAGVVGIVSKITSSK